MRTLRPILAVAALLAPAALRADATPVLQQILEQSARAPVVGFERSVRRLLPERGEPAVLVDRFTPTSPRTGTWSLVSVDGRKPTADEVERHLDSDLVSVIPGFHRLHIVLGAPPTGRRMVDGRTVYQWASLPKRAVETAGGDISANLSAEATVDATGVRPLISEVRIYAARPFSIRGIARMNAFEVVSRYRLGAGPVPVLADQTSMSDVRAPFGLGGKRQRQFEFRPL